MKKVVENFVCEKCGARIIGDGYTDHCPNCLWGKHVDYETPGDRVSDCKGLMEPIRTSFEKGKFRIWYKCTQCSHRFWVREGKNDNRELLVKMNAE